MSLGHGTFTHGHGGWVCRRLGVTSKRFCLLSTVAWPYSESAMFSGFEAVYVSTSDIGGYRATHLPGMFRAHLLFMLRLSPDGACTEPGLYFPALYSLPNVFLSYDRDDEGFVPNWTVAVLWYHVRSEYFHDVAIVHVQVLGFFGKVLEPA